jgi:hypothetical protein
MELSMEAEVDDLEFLSELEMSWKVKTAAGVILFLPKSLVTRDGSIFTMPEWLAIREGLI